MTRSDSSPEVTATPAASVTVTVPPPAGTVADPELEALPLFRVSDNVAPAQPAGRLPTVTLTAFDPERFSITLKPAAVQRETAIALAPRLSVVSATDDAAPTATAARSPSQSVDEGRQVSVRRGRACRGAVARAGASRSGEALALDDNGDAGHGRSARAG